MGETGGAPYFLLELARGIPGCQQARSDVWSRFSGYDVAPLSQGSYAGRGGKILGDHAASDRGTKDHPTLKDERP
jgi:hypothetical protein